MVCAILLLTAAGAAETPVSRLAERLKNSPDFRVRTQAALALGASANKQAVEPLCEGLDDANTTVRAAAAAALGKLRLGGGKCLEDRLAEETNAAVKSVIEKALKRVQEKAAPEAGPDLSQAKFYVAIGKTTNNTSRSDGDIDGNVRRALVKAMKGGEGFAWAPADESQTQAERTLKAHSQLKPVFLWPKVATSYANDTLTLNFSVSVFTYPGKALVGTLSRKLTMMGVGKQSTSDENDLIEAAAERLMVAVAQTAARM